MVLRLIEKASAVAFDPVLYVPSIHPMSRLPGSLAARSPVLDAIDEMKVPCRMTECASGPCRGKA